MTAPAAEPLEIRAIPDVTGAFEVKSRSTAGMRRVDVWTDKDGKYGADCDCPAGEFHPSRRCAHATAVLRQVLGLEFNRMTQQATATEPTPIRAGGLEANIDQAILAIYREVGYVQKKKSQSLGYSFAGEKDIIEKLRPSMVEHGVVARVLSIRDVVHEQIAMGSKGTVQQRTTATTVVRFTHAPSGTWVDCEAMGEGADSGDKGSNKCSTGALKYALRQTFLLETGDDPDDSRPELDNDAPPPRAGTSQNSAPRQQDTAADTATPSDGWKILPRVMQEAGLARKDMLALLDGDFSAGGLAAYLDADPARTIGTLISAARARKEAANGVA